jgi:hypothetical protein
MGESEQSEDEQAFDGQQSELEKIASDHGEQTEGLEQDLRKSEAQDDLDELRRAAKEHARALREAVKELPQDFSDPSYPEGAAASARSSAQMMADALERADLPEAANLGSSAIKSAETAKRLARNERNLFGETSELVDQAERARDSIEREQKWTQQQLEKLRRARAERAKDRLEQAAKDEDRMANRSGDLGRASRDSSAPMPDSAQNALGNAERSMRDAARAFRALDYDKGLSSQREAQRQLEMARDDRGEEGKNQSRKDSAEGDDTGQGAVDIPRAQDFKGPRDFRKRVMDGLGTSADPKLREAIRRYAEGLVR